MTERLLIADRTQHGQTEAEPVTIEATPEAIKLTLDDGQELMFDRRELDAAVHEEAA